MTSFPIDEWAERAQSVKQRFYPGSGKPRLAANAMAELAPEYAELVQVIARGRSYADDTIDLKTRALLTTARLMGMGERAYIENWIQNAMHAGATRDEIVELILQLFVYLGTPKTVVAFEAAKTVFDERGV